MPAVLPSADLKFAARKLLTRHWRDVPDWLQSRAVPDYLLDKPSPWITFPAIRWIRGFLRHQPRARVFEYGSGGSTLFWIRHGCDCVSVEHDPAWLRTVSARTGDARVDLRRVSPEPLAAGVAHDPGDPALYQSNSPEFRSADFRNYVRQIDAFPDGHFDLVLVDGRSRPACIVHGAPKVRVGGALIVDNVERPYYLDRTLGRLGGFERLRLPGLVPTLAMLNETDIFIRRS